MAVDVTKSLIERLIRETVQGGRREVIDRAPGLVLRVGPRGAAWSWKFEKSHQTLRLSIGPYPEWSVADAREIANSATAMVRAKRGIPNQDWLQSERVRLGKADAGAAEPATQKTFGTWDFASARAKYLEVVKATRAVATWRDRIGILNGPDLRIFEKRRVATITRQEFAEVLAGVHARGAERHASHIAEVLRPMWTWLGSDAVVAKSGVTPGAMERLRAPEASRRMTAMGDFELRRGQYVPSVEELARVVAIADAGVLSEALSAALCMLVYTGQRRRMVCSAQVEHFQDLGELGALWTIPAAHRKTAINRGLFSAHVIPLPPSVWTRVKEQIARAEAKRVDEGEEETIEPVDARAKARARRQAARQAQAAPKSTTNWLFPGSRPRRWGDPIEHMHPDNLTHVMRLLPDVAASAHEIRNGLATHGEEILGHTRTQTKSILDHGEAGESNDVTARYALHHGLHAKWPLMTAWTKLIDAALPMAKSAIPRREKLKSLIAAARADSNDPPPRKGIAKKRPRRAVVAGHAGT